MASAAPRPLTSGPEPTEQTLNEPWLGPKADLLEGLLEAGAGDDGKAESLLRAASERSAATNHLEDRAFALECLARVQAGSGESPAALAEALAACTQWGAQGKRARLAAEVCAQESGMVSAESRS